MRKTWRAAFGFSLLLACEETSRAVPDAEVEAAPPPEVTDAPAPVGCGRNGPLEGIELDPACVVSPANEAAMNDFGKNVSVEVEVEPNPVVAGAAARIRVTFTNVSKSEILVLFDARRRPEGPRPDWSRLSGVPKIKDERPDPLPRLQFSVRTLDAREHPVDALPVVLDGGAPTSVPRTLGVRLNPGAKVTRTLPWLALYIPAPAPIFKDDAGHRYVPKTTAIPLRTGDYVISVEAPLHALAPQERTFTADVHVERIARPKVRGHH